MLLPDAAQSLPYLVKKFTSLEEFWGQIIGQTPISWFSGIGVCPSLSPKFVHASFRWYIIGRRKTYNRCGLHKQLRILKNPRQLTNAPVGTAEHAHYLSNHGNLKYMRHLTITLHTSKRRTY